MLNNTIYSVSALNEYIRSLITQDYSLQSIYLRGEISNFRRHTSGHLYFSLKDDKSRIKGVMFAREAMHLSFTPKDGDEVLVLGRIGLYLENGEYQIYVYEMEPYGQGKALLELEKLKKKLEKEGLFDSSRKKAIPSFPQSIGLITAKGSAASKDMIVNIQRRFSLVKIYLFSSLVQGEKAPQALCEALNRAEEYHVDTIIIGRGGGANEDLSAFNDENLVRRIALCSIPVISAVGHEINTTLCDLVADQRVSTPTGAAECATPDIHQLRIRMMEIENKMTRSIQTQYQTYKERLDGLKRCPFFMNPATIYRTKRDSLILQKHKLFAAFQEKFQIERQHTSLAKTNFLHMMQRNLKEQHQILLRAQKQLQALSPAAVLDRGYAYMQDEEGHVIDTIEKVEVGQHIQTITKDGIIMSKVTHKEKKDGKHEKL